MGQFGVSTILGVGPKPAYGEPGHWFAMRQMHGRTIVSFANGRAVFDSPADAETYLEHPGDVGPAARYYLDSTVGDAR